MAGTTLIQQLVDGLSNAAERTSPGTTPRVTGGDAPSITPAAALDRLRDGRVSTIQLPTDRPEYFMRILLRNYERTSWDRVAAGSIVSQVILPLPMALVDDHLVSWEDVELGISGASAMSGASGNMGATIEQLSAVLGQGAAAIASSLHSGATRGVLAQRGLAVNGYLTRMMRGPNYKSREFTWRISPDSPEESRLLSALYVLMNEAQAPGIYGPGAAFFTYPLVLYPSFWYRDRKLDAQLFSMKPCVIGRSSWNFTPQNTPSFYTSTNSPESVEFTLQLDELELWLHGNYAAAAAGSDVRF